jgi:hypothetical protein
VLSLEAFIEAILGIGQEFPFKIEGVGRIVLDALRSLHWDSVNSDDEETSQISDVLIALSEHPVAAIRREANTCLGYVAPFVFVSSLAERIERRSMYVRQDNLGEFSEAIKNAAGGLSDGYYGDMCPGAIEAILEDPDYQSAEYEKMKMCLEPINRVFGGMPGTKTFSSILEDLRPCLEETTEVGEGGPYVDVYTLPLPFDEWSG